MRARSVDGVCVTVFLFNYESKYCVKKPNSDSFTYADPYSKKMAPEVTQSNHLFYNNNNKLYSVVMRGNGCM